MIDRDQDPHQWPDFPPVQNILDKDYIHPLSAAESKRQRENRRRRHQRQWAEFMGNAMSLQVGLVLTFIFFCFVLHVGAGVYLDDRVQKVPGSNLDQTIA